MGMTSSFVPVDQVIATGASIIEAADTVDRAYFKEWVYLGLLELGPSAAWYDEATLYPVDMALEKPKNMYNAIDLALYNASQQELLFAYRGKGKQRIHVSDNSLTNAGTYSPELGAPIDLSEDTYYYHLGTNGGSVSYAILRYWKFPTDENGDLMVPEQDVFTLSLFLKYMFCMRKDDKVGIGQFHNLWIAARNEGRTAHKIPSGISMDEAARSWNSMIQKMRFKRF
jgi:hypothetical protein